MAESNNNTEAVEATKTEKSAESTLYYFYSQGCGWCKKSEPVVDELIASGYDILKLDLAEPDNQGLNQELKQKYNVQCGTPWFIDASSGNGACGFREKDMLELWVKGEKVPEPPRPKGPPPRPPENWDDNKVVDAWKAEYEKWRKDNDHVKNIPPVEQTMERIKKQQEMMAQRQAQGGAPSGASPEIRRIESKLDALINHLGVKWPTTAATKPPVPLQNQAAPVSNQKSQRTGKQPKKS